MRKTNTTVTEYIELYEEEWSRLMAKQHAFASCEKTDRSILTTWTLSFNSLRSESDAAANLLMLCSFLDGQDIWYELFKPLFDSSIVDEEVPPWLADCIRHKLDFKGNMGLLLEYSFIDAKNELSSYSIHSVLHSWCFHRCKEIMASMGRLALMIVVFATFSQATLGRFLAMRRLLPHVDRICSTLPWLLREAVRNEKDLKSISFACHYLADILRIHGKSEDAERMCLVALTGLEELRVPDSMYMYRITETLGKVYLKHGKMKEAEESLLQALVGFQKHLGPDYGLAYGALDKLGELYSKQGKTKEAEDAYLRSLTAKEKTFGFEDSSTLYAVNRLGIFYDDQGRTKEAEDMFLRALNGLERGSGPDYELLPTIVFALGRLYSKDQCKMRETEEMYLRALAGYEKIHGPEHINVITTKQALGCLYSKDNRKMKEAEELYMRALAGFEKILGPEHESVAGVQHDLGILYSKDPCKVKEAEEMYLGALAGYKKIYGLEHESVATIQYHLGFLYLKDPCKMENAEDMLLKALDGYGRIYGSEHKTASNIRYHLGGLYTKGSMFEKAVQQVELALEGYTNLLGPDDEDTIACLEALKVYQQLLEAQKGMSNSPPEDCDSGSESRRLPAS